MEKTIKITAKIFWGLNETVRLSLTTKVSETHFKLSAVKCNSREEAIRSMDCIVGRLIQFILLCKFIEFTLACFAVLAIGVVVVDLY